MFSLSYSRIINIRRGSSFYGAFALQLLTYTYFDFMRRKFKTTFQHVEMPLSLFIHSSKIHCTVRQTVHYL